MNPLVRLRFLFQRYGRRCLAPMLSVLLVISAAAADENLRCGTRLVSVGDSASAVREACGKPDRIESGEMGKNSWIQQWFDPAEGRYKAPRLTKGPVRVEIWTYDLGPRRFIRRLHFQNGELVRIESPEKPR